MNFNEIPETSQKKIKRFERTTCAYKVPRNFTSCSYIEKIVFKSCYLNIKRFYWSKQKSVILLN